MVSESEFTVQGHGVHTAYKEITEALSKRDDIDIKVNSDRPVDIVHIQTVGLYSMRRVLKRDSKKVVSAHVVPDSFIGSIKAAKLWRPIGRWWLKNFYKRADLVLGCSGMVTEELKNDMKLTNVDVLYNTIQMSRYQSTVAEKREARKKLGIESDDFVVMGNGQVQPRKRLDTFVAMAKSMPDAKFFWVGGIPFKHLGAEYATMQKMIKNMPKNCSVTGVIPLEDVRNYYLAADVFTLPATQENHPMCVLEAAGAGLPIILRDIPQYDDTFRGDVMMASSDEEFIDGLKSLRQDKKLRLEYQRRAGNIAKRFDSAVGAEKLVGFYRQLIDGIIEI